MAAHVCEERPLSGVLSYPCDSSVLDRQLPIKVHVHTDSVTNQQGTWALVEIRKGEVVLSMAACSEIQIPDRYTVQVADGVHLYQIPDIAAANTGISAAFVNHSCEPNTYIDTTKRAIVAICDIQAGDQITFNYLSSEDAMDSPFSCLCGSQNCFGTISGYCYLSDADRAKVSHAAPWLLLKYAAV